MSLKDPRVLRLLERMLEGKITEIRPKFDRNSKIGFSYPEINELLETSSEQTIEILDSLAKSDVLKKSFFDKLLVCEKCGSSDLRISIHCPNCGSANIARGRALEHFSCGHVGLEEEFKVDEKYICPKCKKELQVIGKDYRSPGVLHKCRGCGEFFDEPVEKWHCLSCLEHFPKGEVTETDIYSYKLNEAKKDRLTIELKPKREIEEYLRKEGYDVQSSAKIKGASGAEHEVDLFAVKKAEGIEHKILVGISYAENEVGPEEVLKLYAKAYDVGAEDRILIAMPKINKIAQKLATFYQIKVLEADDLSKAIPQLIAKVLEGRVDES